MNDSTETDERMLIKNGEIHILTKTDTQSFFGHLP